MANADRDAIYARVSGATQEHEQTIDTQLFKIHQHFDPEGRPVYETYLDNPFTGTVLNRPGLDACLQAARAGHFNRVLVDHPDRLSRGEAWHLSYIESQFEQAGIRVEYAGYQRQHDAAGQLLHDIVGAVSNFERKNIVRRMSAGRERQHADGRIWRGKRVYGWHYEKGTAKKHDGKLEIVPEEAAILREVFDHILAGKTAYTVVELLQARGVRNVNGNPWSIQNVLDAIHNPLHSGYPPINRFESILPKKPRKPENAGLHRSTRERPKAEWIRVELPDRIVTVEEQERAEACLLLNQKRATRNSKHAYLLSGLLRCGHEIPYAPGTICGRGMYGYANRAGNRYYHCNRRKGDDPRMTVCCKGFVKADEIERTVWVRVRQVLEQPDAFAKELAAANGDRAERMGRMTGELAAAHAAVDGSQAKLNSLLHRHLAGHVDDETYAQVQAELVTDRENARERIAYIERGLEEDSEQMITADDLKLALAFAGVHWVSKGKVVATLYAESQRKAIRELVTAVWVYPDGRIQIDGVIPLPSPDAARMGDVAASGSIVKPIPSYALHNSTPSDRPAVKHWSLVIAA